jgi:hypothetical protein
MHIRFIWILTFFANFARGFILKTAASKQPTYKNLSPISASTTISLNSNRNSYISSTSYKNPEIDRNIADNLIKIIGDINDLPKDEKKTLKMRIWKSSDLKKNIK